jgi:hypothetical protein
MLTVLYISVGCVSAIDFDDANSTIVSIDENSQLYNGISLDDTNLQSGNGNEEKVVAAGDYVQISDHETGSTGSITTSNSSVSIDMTWSGAGGTTLYLYVDDVETSMSYSIGIWDNYGSATSAFTYNFAKEGTYVLKVDTGSHIYESNHLTYIYQNGGSTGGDNGSNPEDGSASISIYDIAYPTQSTITSDGNYTANIAYDIVKSGDGFSDESLEVFINGQSVGVTTPNSSNRLGNITFDEDNEWELKVVYTAIYNGQQINATSNVLKFITRNSVSGNNSGNSSTNESGGDTPGPQPGEIQVIIRDANYLTDSIIDLNEKYNVLLEYYVTVPEGSILTNDLIILCNGQAITTINPVDKKFTTIGDSILINETGNYVFTAKYMYAVFMSEVQGTITSNSITYHVAISNGTEEINPTVSISIDDVTYPNQVTATVKSNIDGIYTIIIGENSYEVTVTNGTCSRSFSLPVNSYTAEVVSNTNSSLRNSTAFTVFPKVKQTPVVKANVSIDGSKTALTFNFPNDINNENLTVVLNGEITRKTTINNGIAIAEFENLADGDYSYNFIYGGNENYSSVNAVMTFSISNSNVNDTGNGTSPDNGTGGNSNQSGYVGSTISASDLVRGYGSSYDFKAIFYDKDGEVLKDSEVNFIVNGNDNIVKTDEFGIAKISNKLDVGSYAIQIRNYATGEIITKNLEIVARISGNKNINVDYSFSKSYKIRLFADNGQAVGAGEKVIITINKVKNTVITDKNGYASFVINGLVPKTYTITAEYKGVKVSNRVVVKQILKANNVKFKKSKKVKKFKATLKTSSGKAISGKKITLKVNGKTYKATTNKKGVATFNIKNLKKVGKFKATITYLKTSIYKTISVRR